MTSFGDALLFLAALASAADSAASGPAAVVDWTRGATGGVTASTGTSFASLEDSGYTTAILNVTYVNPDTNATHAESGEIGKYGEGRVGEASGILVHVGVGDDHGCNLPLVDPLPKEPWVALIRRGECNFDVKVENAYRSSAAGVLVFDNRNSSNVQRMELSRNRNISAVLTPKWKGEELARLVDEGTKVYVSITVGNHCYRQFGNINNSSSLEGHPARRLCDRPASFSPLYSTNRKTHSKMSLSFCDPKAPSRKCVIATSVLFVSISFIVLMIISLAWLVFYYIQRFRYIHAKDRLARRLCNAAKKALSKIPTKHIKSEDREIQGEGECCAVCIEPYKVSDVIRILPCKHEFHKSCIDPWLLEHRTCPMCKMDILKYYGFMFTGSQESILHIDMDDAVLGSSDSHEQSSPAVVAVAASIMITESGHSRSQSNALANSQSESDEQVATGELASSRAPSPDEFTPTLGHCTYMVVSEIDTLPSNSLSSSEKGSKSSNKDEMLRKDEQGSMSCDRISLNSEKFSDSTLVKDSTNELDAKPVIEPCSESIGLPEHDKGDNSMKKQ